MSDLKKEVCSCGCCGFETMCKYYEADSPRARPLWLCELCAGSVFSSRVMYKSTSAEDYSERQLYQHILYVGNAIIVAIRGGDL